VSRRRRIAIWVLVVLATIIALVSTLTLWVKRQMLDNTAWNKASQQLIQNPDVRSTLSVYLVNQLYQNVNVEQAIAERLPKNLQSLAAPVAGALRAPASSTVNFMLGRPRVQQLFINASATAHQKLVNVLENKTGNGISTGNGEVTINLSQLVTELAKELGLPDAAIAKIPPDAGTVNVMKSSQLSTAQSGVRVIKVLSVWLLVLVILLYAAAVYIARGGRRVVLRRVGWSLVLLGVLVLVIRKVIGNYVVNALTSPTYHKTGHEVWAIGTSILGQIGYATLLYGIVIVLGAVLAGGTRPARDARRLLTPVFKDRPGVVYGAAGFLFLLAVLWGGTHALRTWWGVVLIGALLAVGVEALRRQTLAEAAAAAAVPPAPAQVPESGKGLAPS
jgi:hypothetical protein